jgi:hypothetical protein
MLMSFITCNKGAMLICMAEDPTKLFATRAERYPEPTEADTAGNREGRDRRDSSHGGPINQVLSLVLAPAVGRRRDEWLKELSDALDQMEKNVAGFRVEKLADNEAFVSATIQGTLIAIGTHQREKREYLRNALMNIAKGITSDKIKQPVFLNAIEASPPAHIKAAARILTGSDNGLSPDEAEPKDYVLNY